MEIPCPSCKKKLPVDINQLPKNHQTETRCSYCGNSFQLLIDTAENKLKVKKINKEVVSNNDNANNSNKSSGESLKKVQKAKKNKGIPDYDWYKLGAFGGLSTSNKIISKLWIAVVVLSTIAMYYYIVKDTQYGYSSFSLMFGDALAIMISPFPFAYMFSMFGFRSRIVSSILYNFGFVIAIFIMIGVRAQSMIIDNEVRTEISTFFSNHETEDNKIIDLRDKAFAALDFRGDSKLEVDKLSINKTIINEFKSEVESMSKSRKCKVIFSDLMKICDKSHNKYKLNMCSDVNDSVVYNQCMLIEPVSQKLFENYIAFSVIAIDEIDLLTKNIENVSYDGETLLFTDDEIMNNFNAMNESITVVINNIEKLSSELEMIYSKIQTKTKE